jgi:3-deoxy-D-manno-octulosonate 8-phosphate phosphatase (KDO 8-P phosphatase)
MFNLEKTAQLFQNQGAEILRPFPYYKTHFPNIKAFLFDWDGVFNEGWKGEGVPNPFSEIDSMGINMLRFGIWLKTGHLPQVFIITGLKNLSAKTIANREGFTALYLEMKNKSVALEHIKATHSLEPENMVCFFDDVLDVPMAKDCAFRMFVNRPSNPLFKEYLLKNKLCDYVTACKSGESPIREACEFILGMAGGYDQTIAQRIAFSEEFQAFMSFRATIKPTVYHLKDQKIALLEE